MGCCHDLDPWEILSHKLQCKWQIDGLCTHKRHPYLGVLGNLRGFYCGYEPAKLPHCSSIGMHFKMIYDDIAPCSIPAGDNQ